MPISGLWAIIYLVGVGICAAVALVMAVWNTIDWRTARQRAANSSWHYERVKQKKYARFSLFSWIGVPASMLWPAVVPLAAGFALFVAGKGFTQMARDAFMVEDE